MKFHIPFAFSGVEKLKTRYIITDHKCFPLCLCLFQDLFSPQGQTLHYDSGSDDGSGTGCNCSSVFCSGKIQVAGYLLGAHYSICSWCLWNIFGSPIFSDHTRRLPWCSPDGRSRTFTYLVSYNGPSGEAFTHSICNHGL